VYVGFASSATVDKLVNVAAPLGKQTAVGKLKLANGLFLTTKGLEPDATQLLPFLTVNVTV
jgi:hypothetical protein